MNKITKITLTIVALALVSIYGAQRASAADAETLPEVENTAVLCSDGIDNDFNGTSDLSDPSCAAFVPVVENTLGLCSDSIDNDFNGTSDLGDPSCSAFVVVTENTSTLCSDGIDNDFNGTSDLGDPSCAAFVVVPPSTPTDNGGNTGGNGGSGSAGPTAVSGGGGSIIPAGLPAGQSVLGAFTGPATSTASTTCPYLTTYMKMGKKNYKTDVIRLQSYLNLKYGAKLPVTGFFGKQTKNAVFNLQTLKKEQIMQPWVDAGLATSLRATGYVFKTTQRFINMEMCPDMNFPIPDLK